MAPLRFVHAADLHLDSPFAGAGSGAPQAVRETLLAATFSAYDNLVELCVNQHANALLIAGDIYDGADRSLRAQIAFAKGLEQLHEAGVRTFICHGNHDPLDGWDAKLSHPPSVHRFGPEVTSAPLDPARPEGAVVYGVSYPRQQALENLVPQFRRRDNAEFAIGLLHANVGSNTGHQPYAPCTLEDLSATGIDYWALGHVHTRQVLRPCGPTVAYSGNPQGRHVNETGERGAFVVDVSAAGEVTMSFRPLDVVRWHRIEADVSGAEDIQDVLDAVERQVASAVDGSGGRPIMYRLHLTGRTTAYADVLRGANLEDVQARLNEEWASQRPFAWCERITHALRPEFDRERALSANDFLAEVLSGVDAARADPATLAELRGALEPLYGGRTRRILRDLIPDDDELRRLLTEAELECVERLQGGPR